MRSVGSIQREVMQAGSRIRFAEYENAPGWTLRLGVSSCKRRYVSTGAPLEVEADAEADDARIEKRGHLLEGGAGGVAEGRDRPGVGQVEHVDHPVSLPNLPNANSLVEPEVEDLHRRAAVGGDRLDADGLRAVARERHADRAAPLPPLCTFHDPEKPMSHGNA